MLSREGRPARVSPDVSRIAAASAPPALRRRHQRAHTGPVEDPFRSFQTELGSFFPKRRKRSLRVSATQQQILSPLASF